MSERLARQGDPLFRTSPSAGAASPLIGPGEPVAPAGRSPLTGNDHDDDAQQTTQASEGPTPPEQPVPAVDEVVLRQTATKNPLLGAAMPLLTLVCQLRGTLRNDNVPRLQFMVSEEMKIFESRALLAEASPQDVVAARYVLCSLIDETVLSTPWGSQSSWASQTMLSVFHRETWGGEKVFVILDRVKTKPARYLHLVELIDMVLALGFRGRFEVLDNGLYQLEDLRSEVWRAIVAQRGSRQTPLSPEIIVERSRRALVSYLPLWVVAAAAAVILLVVYGAFQYSLSRNLDRVDATLDSITARPGATP